MTCFKVGLLEFPSPSKITQKWPERSSQYDAQEKQNQQQQQQHKKWESFNFRHADKLFIEIHFNSNDLSLQMKETTENKILSENNSTKNLKKKYV